MIHEHKGLIYAEELLEDLGFESLPIAPIQVAAAISDDSFPIIIEAQNFQSNQILGKALGNERGALVYINSNIPDPGRYKFTEAHELGHVCMHIMEEHRVNFACGMSEITDYFKDPFEQQANGFASGLLMPKQLIKKLIDNDVNWWNIKQVKEHCLSSYEATFRRLIKLYKEPVALVIHQDRKFKRFVASDSFAAYIGKLPLSLDQQEFYIDGLSEEFPCDYHTAPASGWVDPEIKGETLEAIYVSGISLKNRITYTLLRYDDECFQC